MIERDSRLMTIANGGTSATRLVLTMKRSASHPRRGEPYGRTKKVTGRMKSVSPFFVTKSACRVECGRFSNGVKR
jgi:hypothetical protein